MPPGEIEHRTEPLRGEEARDLEAAAAGAADHDRRAFGSSSPSRSAI